MSGGVAEYRVAPARAHRTAAPVLLCVACFRYIACICAADSARPSTDFAKDSASRAQIIFGVGGYMVISSLLLVLNKLAIHFLQAPSFLLFAQLFSSWASVKLAAMAGIIQCDPLTSQRVKGFWLVSMCFLISIFTNIKTLQYCNVETFIVFRCGAPIVICVADWWFLGRELPNKKSALSLIVIFLGATAYVLTDKNFSLTGYKWLIGWLATFTFDQV